MQINVKRFEHSKTKGNRGVVLVNGELFGFSIECPEMFNKKDFSRISPGKYWAKKVKTKNHGLCWVLFNSHGRTGIILFHPGNTRLQFSGCLGVGERCLEKFTKYPGERGVTNTTTMCKRFMEITKDEETLIVIIENI